MAMRLSGLMSGMDTDTVVSQLVEARRTKVDAKKKEQTKLSWKQDAWKELNTKLKSLQQKFISNMRFEGAYAKKTTNVSNSSAVSVITGENAVEGVQELKIKQLAKTAYFTGAKIQSQEDESEITALTKMSDIKDFDASKGTQYLAVKTGMGDNLSDVRIEITKDTTISDVLNGFKNAGLNASFDAAQQRFFVSSKDSGKNGNFNIIQTDASGNSTSESNALSVLGLNITKTSGNVPTDITNFPAKPSPQTDGGATYIYGQDAQIELNGAIFENSSNVFEINGLTFTALNETADGEVITITTKQDTDGIYDMVKNFLKEYNSIINEIDKLYNAEINKGYEPLTDEEKEAMSDTEVEKYEQKIKDSILRRDENLSTVGSALKQIMLSGFEVDGQKMYLSNFGISTLSYFTAPENEKNAYHIDGDPDDSSTSGNSDKLKSMIASDPDKVISFFTQLSQSLYSKMTEMSGTSSTRTFGNFYDDKKMKSDYDSYTSKIADLEQKLNDYEDKWYSKFSKMETAMAKMQQNASAVTSLLGGS